MLNNKVLFKKPIIKFFNIKLYLQAEYKNNKYNTLEGKLGYIFFFDLTFAFGSYKIIHAKWSIYDIQFKYVYIS